MSRQAVAGAARNDTERSVGMNKRTSHFVDGAVATYGNHDVCTLTYSISRELRGMSGIFRETD